MKAKTKYEGWFTTTYTFTVRELVQALLDKYDIEGGEGQVEFIVKNADAGRIEPDVDFVNLVLKSPKSTTGQKQA